MDALHPTLSFIVGYGLQFVILFFPLWFFVVDKYAAGFREFGFRKVSWKSLISTVLLSYLAYVIIVALGLTIAEYFFNFEVPGFQQQESYLPLFGIDALGLSTAVLFIVFIAPFLEELFFRGFVYRTFLKVWPTWLSSILAAALFALLHFQWGSIVPLFLLGLVLNYVYHRTRSVWTAVAFHMLNNAIAFAAQTYTYFNPDFLEELEEFAAFLYTGFVL